jgi:hypothetical protein
MLACAELAGLNTSSPRAFLERARLKVDDFVKAGISLIYLEDVGAGIRSGNFSRYSGTFHLPASSLQPSACRHRRDSFSRAARKRAQRC